MVASSNSNGLTLAAGPAAVAGALVVAAMAEPGTTTVLVTAARRRNVRRFIRQILFQSWARGTVAELLYVQQASNMSQPRARNGSERVPRTGDWRRLPGLVS